MGTIQWLSVAVAVALMQGVLPAQTPSGTATHSAPPVLYSKAADPVVFGAQAPGFVIRSGATLMLNGKPFRFVGLNIYNATNQGACWYSLGTPSSLNDTLTAIGSGQTVFRTWFFQPMATRHGQRDWSTFDATLAAARAHDERIIATLGNQYADCQGTGPVSRTEAWYRDGYASARDDGMPSTYRDWVAEVVSRYRDDPTIMAWQLMNEAAVATPGGRCSATASRTLKKFAQDVSGLVKRIDPNHLVSLGTMGVRECGTIGAEYQDVHSVPGIDLCEVHDYSSPGSVQAPGLQLRMAQCRALNKPLFVGEMGVRVQDAGTLANRASMLRNKLTAQFGAGISGALVWDWANGDQVAYSGYEIQPGDPALQVLAEAL